MLFPLEKKPQRLTVSLAVWSLRPCWFTCRLWVKQRAAHGRTLSAFLFCFSTSENWMSSWTRVALCGLEGLCNTQCASLSCTRLSTKLLNCSCWLLWPLLGCHPSSSQTKRWKQSGDWEAPGFWRNKGVWGDEKWAGRVELHDKLPVIHGQQSTLHLAELVLQHELSSWCYGWLNAT